MQWLQFARFACVDGRVSTASPLQSKGHHEPRTLLSPAFSQCEAAAHAVSGGGGARGSGWGPRSAARCKSSFCLSIHSSNSLLYPQSFRRLWVGRFGAIAVGFSDARAGAGVYVGADGGVGARSCARGDGGTAVVGAREAARAVEARRGARGRCALAMGALAMGATTAWLLGFVAMMGALLSSPLQRSANAISPVALGLAALSFVASSLVQQLSSLRCSSAQATASTRGCSSGSRVFRSCWWGSRGCGAGRDRRRDRIEAFTGPRDHVGQLGNGPAGGGPIPSRMQ